MAVISDVAEPAGPSVSTGCLEHNDFLGDDAAPQGVRDFVG
ncbi:hypothetical protein [Streptomyces sp. NPDC096323]